MRDAELYRRPPFLVGDEPAVVRHRRGFRMRRRAVQGAFVGAVIGVGLLLRAAGADALLPAAAAFAAVSGGFMVGHLAVGKRVWMKPVEAYEDGIAGSEITLLFCRRRFWAWKEVEAVGLDAAGGAPPRLVVTSTAGRRMESAPGEFDEKGLEAMRGRLERARAEAARQREIFESVGKEGVVAHE